MAKKRKLKSVEQLEALGFVHGASRERTHVYHDPELMYITANDMVRHDMEANGVEDVPHFAFRTKVKKGAPITVINDDGEEEKIGGNFSVVTGAKWVTNKTKREVITYEKEKGKDEKTGKVKWTTLEEEVKDEEGNVILDEEGKPMMQKIIKEKKMVDVYEGDDLSGKEYSDLLHASVNCYVDPKTGEVHCENKRMLEWIEANAFE